MNILKLIAKNWLPPILLRWIRQARGGSVRFEGCFETWEKASAQCTGYDADDILAKVLEATLKVKNGEAAFERDSVLFDKVEYALPVLSGLMWAAARNGGVLNVLDFGGALGSSYFQNRNFLLTLPSLKWNVVEQSHYVEAGQAYIQDDVVHFYKSIDACLVENMPNVILLSSVLQYLEEPIEIIEKLATVGASVLIIDRTPFVMGKQDMLMIQHVPTSIYQASYPMWAFSESNLMKILNRDWKLFTEILSPEGVVRSTDGLIFSFKGALMGSRK